MGKEQELEANSESAWRGSNLAGKLRRCGFYLLVAAGLFSLTADGKVMTGRYFLRQDAPVLALGGIALILFGLFTPRSIVPLRIPPRYAALLLAAFAFLFALAGWWLVFEGHAFSRDELLADFDADILKRGLLIGPIATGWQGLAPAMMAIHMLEIPPQAGWMSSYLPVNALIRAGMDMVADRSLASPLLGAFSILALFAVARRLWPERQSLAVLAIVLLAFAPQFLATAMTPFAMTGHLALNLAWLWLFLRDRRGSDLAAILVGFLATGLHQIVFHPLFVLPFIAVLLLDRRWGRAALFVGGYLLIGLFWASYWKVAMGVAGVAAPIGATQSPVLFQRLLTILAANDITAFPLMALNLLRLVAWQHILLLPLVLLAWPSIKAGEGIARPLAAGFLLMIATVLVLLPWQGAGWGYRYVHGLLGNLCLLACYGWLRAEASLAPESRRGLLIAGSAFTLLLTLPFQLIQTNRLTGPYREASAFLERSNADIVIVDPSDVEMGHELVRNSPDMSNRPLMIDLGVLRPEQLEALCARRRFALFDLRHARALGIGGNRLIMPTQRRFHALRCGEPLPLPG